MRRKIIKQGHSTLTITLPNKWARDKNLQSGDEIDLAERENGLFISTEKHRESKIATIDIIGLNIPTIWKYLMAAYREGYDEIKIIYDPNETYSNPYKFYATNKINIKHKTKSQKQTPFEFLHNIINRFIGFEIIEHRENYCIIKDMGEISSKEFENSLRRVFLLLQQMCEEVNQAIKSNDIKIVKYTQDIDINVDKFHDYCIRVLNKTGFKEQHNSTLLFCSLYHLELLGDELKNIAFHLTEDLKDSKLDNLAKIAESILKEFNDYYYLFYHFSKEKIMELSKSDLEMYFEIPKKFDKNGKSTLNSNELEVFQHFRRIARYINALYELRIEMEF